uniref:Uncharacterized protein n=1 Tax=viral metagenome TaxID=1070528 RepID=A0A6H1Z7H8_9ZZZZ
MSPAKYVKIGGVWSPVVAEYVKVGGAWTRATSNYAKVGGAWEHVPVGANFILACEQFSDRCYAIDDTPGVVAGWPYSAPSNPYVVCYNGLSGNFAEGTSYWAVNNVIYALNADGSFKWSYSGFTNTIFSIACSIESAIPYIYAGDYVGNVRKLVDGTVAAGLIWNKGGLAYGSTIYSLAVDAANGFVYAGTGRVVNSIYGGLASTGNFTMRYLAPAGVGVITALAVQPSGRLMAGSGNGYLLSIEQTGTGYVFWTKNPALEMYAVRVGHDGYGYYAGGASKTVAKFVLAGGTEAWRATLGGTASCVNVAPDQFGNVYAAYRVAGTSTDNVLRKLNSNGAEEWSWQPYVAAQFHGIAVSPGIAAAGF